MLRNCASDLYTAVFCHWKHINSYGNNKMPKQRPFLGCFALQFMVTNNSCLCRDWKIVLLSLFVF